MGRVSADRVCGWHCQLSRAAAVPCRGRQRRQHLPYWRPCWSGGLLRNQGCRRPVGWDSKLLLQHCTIGHSGLPVRDLLLACRSAACMLHSVVSTSNSLPTLRCRAPAISATATGQTTANVVVTPPEVAPAGGWRLYTLIYCQGAGQQSCLQVDCTPAMAYPTATSCTLSSLQAGQTYSVQASVLGPSASKHHLQVGVC